MIIVPVETTGQKAAQKTDTPITVHIRTTGLTTARVRTTGATTSHPATTATTRTGSRTTGRQAAGPGRPATRAHRMTHVHPWATALLLSTHLITRARPSRFGAAARHNERYLCEAK